MLRFGFIAMLFLSVSLQVGASIVAATASSSLKGYHEWKNEKVQSAVNQGASLRQQLIKAQTEGNRKQVEALEKQQMQLNWNIEVARDLSVTDYVVLYLSQQNHPDRFQQAAQKMSTKEVAELMEAYSNTLEVTPSENVVKPAPQAVVPAKLPIQAIQAK